MKKKLDTILLFLKNNRQYNKEPQEKYYKSVITPYNSTEERVVSLLYNIANSQSKPNIDKLAEFFQKIHKKLNQLNSFGNFLSYLNKDTNISYYSLFIGLKNQPGWGDKTSALFTKSIYHLHNGQYKQELEIWKDTPREFVSGDIIYLPVDAVIIAIFKKIEPNKTWSFNTINEKLHEYYNSIEMEVWDDLWYWGFITQFGSGNNRQFEWNPNKYWMMRESNKKQNRIDEIHQKAIDFLEIINDDK